MKKKSTGQERLPPPDSKTYDKTIVFKIVKEETKLPTGKKGEPGNRSPCVLSPNLWQGISEIWRENENLSTNSVGAIGYPYGKQLILTPA